MNTGQEAHKPLEFIEYELKNGLHVILHQDKTVPVVVVSVMYRVGSKNDSPDKTGFAHFFEHLLFEGSVNVPRGRYDKIVQAAGGALNANTSVDRTFYFEILPSNHLATGLWLESERMLHARIDKIGIETQRSVIKEERRQRYDNVPYGRMFEETMKRLYEGSSYNWPVIGSIEHIEAATEADVRFYYDTFYKPDNAVLCVAGDFENNEARDLIQKYFETIPQSTDSIIRPDFKPASLNSPILDKVYDQINLPAVIYAYRGPAYCSSDFYALRLLADILGHGDSSRLVSSLVYNQKLAIQINASLLPWEYSSPLLITAIANNQISIETLEESLRSEINGLQLKPISDSELQRAKNKVESSIVRNQELLISKAEILSTFHTYFKNASSGTMQHEFYQAVTLDDIARVYEKYIKSAGYVNLQWLSQKEFSTN